MRFKLQPCDVQETLVGLLAHCLAMLQERGKAMCIFNRKKSLKAKRVGESATSLVIILIFMMNGVCGMRI